MSSSSLKKIGLEKFFKVKTMLDELGDEMAEGDEFFVVSMDSWF